MKLFTAKKPNDGEVRKFKSFAFYPVKVWDTNTKSFQWIWFERYHVNQVYKTDWSSWGAEKRWVTEVRYI